MKGRVFSCYSKCYNNLELGLLHRHSSSDFAMTWTLATPGGKCLLEAIRIAALVHHPNPRNAKLIRYADGRQTVHSDR